VASRYDLMNDLMSAGVHRIWKSVFITRLDPQPGELLLDLAGGTGDIASGFLKRADRRTLRGRAPARAILCDINEEMLRAGKARREAAEFGARIERLCANAERLPLHDNIADAYTIAFGIRNVTDIAAALQEAFRALRPGGRFFCLEFSHPVTEGLQRLYDAYSFNVIPRLGEVVAKDRESYQYLVESIRRFPTQEAFAGMIARAGFSRVKYENLTGGVAAIHSGWRI
ncbi:MAG TPA: class I SAM-dependent methyltransferase, partial [Parvularculaceae bacterium]|nr:class I SAM-dependent methyltransferase [Parvularculaceae bacterium]